jgi:hypothetical protein
LAEIARAEVNSIPAIIPFDRLDGGELIMAGAPLYFGSYRSLASHQAKSIKGLMLRASCTAPT